MIYVLVLVFAFGGGMTSQQIDFKEKGDCESAMHAVMSIQNDKAGPLKAAYCIKKDRV